MATVVTAILQNSDIIAPELTPLKDSWNENEGEEQGGRGGSNDACQEKRNLFK